MKQVKVIWTKRAITDLENIGDFLAQKSPSAAFRLINKILDVEKYFLSHLFLDGPSQVTISKMHDYRYIVHSRHKIIYYRSKGILFIVAVFDTRQSPNKLKL